MGDEMQICNFNYTTNNDYLKTLVTKQKQTSFLIHLESGAIFADFQREAHLREVTPTSYSVDHG